MIITDFIVGVELSEVKVSRLARILLWGFAILCALSGVVFGVGIWRYRAHIEQTVAQGQRYELSSIDRVPLARSKTPQVVLTFKTPEGATRQIDSYAVSQTFYDQLKDHPKAPMHVRLVGEPTSALPVLEEDATWMVWRASRLLWGPLLLTLLGICCAFLAWRALRRAA